MLLHNSHSHLASAALSLLAVSFSPRASAAAVQRCPVDDVCYQVAVPETSASSGAGNIYVQVRAPSSYTWAALGTGQAMAGANMFVVYADGAGNVTVSPRAGTGHTAPSADGSASRLELLAGSGVLNGTTMVANFRCANCASWSGGSMSLSSDATDWIAAWKVGDPIDSTDVDAPIQYHDAHDGWSFDLTQATVADDANPFVGGAEAEAGAGSDAGNDSGNNSNANSGVSPSSFQDPRPLIFAHGIIMAIVMVVLYPLGSVLMPLFGKWFVHAGFQSTAFLLMWAGFGLGIVSAQRINLNFDSVHTQLGTVVVCLMAVQPALGYVHHRHFVKHQARGIVSHGHIWYGRALMIMGIVNGGLGLALTGASQAFVIVYSVVAGVAFVVYTACATLGEVRRRRRRAPSTDSAVSGDSIQKTS